MKTAKKATVMTSTTAKATATITQNQNAVIRGTFYGLRDPICGCLGGFGLQTSARMPFDGDRHDAGAMDDSEHPCQPDGLAPGREVDADHRHGGVTAGAIGHLDRLCRIPGPLGIRAAAPADEIEHHPPVDAHGRGIPTSLHITYNGGLLEPLAAGGVAPI